MEKNELEERIEHLERTVRYNSALLDLIRQEFSICGISRDSNVENLMDLCRLKVGHDGMHENLMSFKWGF